jgi:uncharacterized membrane protein
MHPEDFHKQLDQDRLTAALQDAERATAGKINVYVSHGHIEDALSAARERFGRLGLHLHDHRASVLIYIAPKTHKFAVLGDKAIHEKCGEAYWQQLADRLAVDLKKGDLTAALLNAIASLKATMAEHFPAFARH